VADLRDFAASSWACSRPQAWDWPYVSEKLKEARYAFSEQEVKQYFTAPKVLAGCSRSSRRCSRCHPPDTRAGVAPAVRSTASSATGAPTQLVASST
jgi:hypothetical protein